MTAAPILTLEGVEVVYQRAITALHGVSLAVGRGEVVALLGANGAGKTTTLRAASGFIGLDNARVTRGRVTYEGRTITHAAPHVTTRQGIVLIPERDKVFPNLTVAENLAAVAPAREGAAARRRLEPLVYEFFPRLAGLKDRLAGLLSGGERQMLAVGAAILCGPRLLLVDELSLGLAPVVVEELAERLLAIRRELDLSILLVEQSAAVALRLADRGYVLENGRVALAGSAAALMGSEAVRQAYLGTGASDAGRRSYREAARLRGARDPNHA